MKGALLLSNDPRLFDRVLDALVRAGGAADQSRTMVQFADEHGRLFTVFRQEPGDDSSWRLDPPRIVMSRDAPDLATVTGCDIECRWEEMFCDVVTRLTAELPNPAWVLDEGDTLWSASDLDPARLQL